MRRLVKQYREQYVKRGYYPVIKDLERVVAEEVLFGFVDIEDAEEIADSKTPFLAYTAAGFEVNKSDLKWAIMVYKRKCKQF